MLKTGAVWLSFDGIWHKIWCFLLTLLFQRVLKWCCMLFAASSVTVSFSTTKVSPWIQPQFMQASEILHRMSVDRYLMDDSCQLPALFRLFLVYSLWWLAPVSWYLYDDHYVYGIGRKGQCNKMRFCGLDFTCIWWRHRSALAGWAPGTTQVAPSRSPLRENG